MKDGAHCVNISGTGERRRRLSGWAALWAGAIVVAGLAIRGASPAAYLVVFPFALGGTLGLLQARERTCVVLGLRGGAEVEGGGLRRLEPAERAMARRQARRVLWKSVAVAAVVTLLALLAAGVGVTP